MPKDEPHLHLLREQRKAKRAKMSADDGADKDNSGKTVSSVVSFQTLGNGDAILLYTDHNRMLFNCPEGTQRIATEQCPPRYTLSKTQI